LVDVPEMGYLHTDSWHGEPPKPDATSARDYGNGIPCVGRGEICYRGPCVFKGYYKLPEKTAEAVDADGWLHSGDIGLWTLEGNLKIVDRKKDIFKLSQGEYVAAEKIANVLQQSPLVAQAFVYGDSYQSHLVAILAVDEEAVATRFNIGAGSEVAAMCADRASPLHAAISEDVLSLSSKARLAGFETVRAFSLEPKLFSVEDGLLTPTFKLKRHAAQLKFQATIDELYKLPPSAASKPTANSKL